MLQVQNRPIFGIFKESLNNNSMTAIMVGEDMRGVLSRIEAELFGIEHVKLSSLHNLR